MEGVRRLTPQALPVNLFGQVLFLAYLLVEP